MKFNLEKPRFLPLFLVHLKFVYVQKFYFSTSIKTFSIRNFRVAFRLQCDVMLWLKLECENTSNTTNVFSCVYRDLQKLSICRYHHHRSKLKCRKIVFADCRVRKRSRFLCCSSTCAFELSLPLFILFSTPFTVY